MTVKNGGPEIGQLRTHGAGVELTIYNLKTRFSFRERNGLKFMKNQVLVDLIMKCVSEFLSNYNSKWAQAAESNQAEEVDGSLPEMYSPIRRRVLITR